MSVVPGKYWVVGGQGIDEFRTSRDIGRDNQHRHNYEVTVRCFDSGEKGSVSGSAFRIPLRIEGSERIDGSNEHLKFKGVALLPSGMVKVRGTITFAVGHVLGGNLDTVSKKRCNAGGCNKANIEHHTIEDRCKKCGEVLEVIRTYSLI